MTRINTASTAVPKPDSVLIGELAIAAGLAGQPIAVFFSESTTAMDWVGFMDQNYRASGQRSNPARGRAMRVVLPVPTYRSTEMRGSAPRRIARGL